MTVKLTDFLTARQDADAEWAENVLGDPTAADLHGIAGRMLREVEAKRRILAEHPHRDDGVYGRGCDTCHWDREFGFNMLDAGSCETLRAVAGVYSDHPDYDPAWT